MFISFFKRASISSLLFNFMDFLVEQESKSISFSTFLKFLEYNLTYIKIYFEIKKVKNL